MRFDRARASRSILFLVVLAVSFALMPVPPAAAIHGDCVLDVVNDQLRQVPGDPGGDDDSHGIGEAHTMTATLLVHDREVVCTPLTTIVVHFENESGPNDPDGTTSPSSPDRFCTIPAGAIQPTCAVGYFGLVGGTDVWRAWLNHDNNASTFDGDPTEGVFEQNEPGSGDVNCGFLAGQTAPEPDCTDVTRAVFGAAFTSLDCDDANGPDTERETNPSRAGSASNEVYTCTLYRANGQVFSSTTDHFVYGEVENGINDPDPDAASEANPPETQPSYNSPDYRCQVSESGATAGSCQITVQQLENEDGTAEICFWATTVTDPQQIEAQGRLRCQQEGEPTGEAQSGGGNPGPDVGNDFADQVELTWQVAVGNSVDAEPESGVSNVGDPYTVTGNVYNQFGTDEVGNNTIKAEFLQGSPNDTDGNTPESPDISCTTQNSNSCSFNYTSTVTGNDALCVWVGADPAIPNSSNNTNPTCAGEGLNDGDDEPGTLDAPEPDDRRDVIRVTWQPPGGATRLDCTPETATAQAGSGHRVTCLATNPDGAPVSGVRVDVEMTGANDTDNDSPLSPDFSCETGASGTCEFVHGAGGTGTTSNPGKTTYGAWIDADNDNTSSERDSQEDRDEAAKAGLRPEPDATDFVEVTWGAARTIDCEPETASRQLNTDHTITCTVRDRANQPAPGESVTFTESGPGTIVSSTATTDNSGQATVTVRSAEEGTQSVTGTLTNDTGAGEPADVDECDRASNDPAGAPAGVCEDVVQVTWATSPSPSPTGSPTTPGPTGPFDRRVTLSASKNRIKFDRSFTLSGRVENQQINAPTTCIAGVTVAIERDVFGGATGFEPFATTVTNTSGVYSLNFKADKNATYVAKVAENSPPGCNGAQSANENVLVRVKVRLKASDTRLNRPRNVTLTARIIPCDGHEGDQLTLLRKNQGGRKFRRVAIVNTDGSCVARFRGRLNVTASFRVKWTQQDQDHISGKSGKVTIRVG